MMERITARKNPLLQQVRKLLTSRKERREAGLFVADGTKLFAIVDGAAVEMEYCNTISDGVFFSTIEGATNYVYADAVKVVEEPKDEPSAAPTGDNMAVFAILGAVALAGAFTFKKVR